MLIKHANSRVETPRSKRRNRKLKLRKYRFKLKLLLLCAFASKWQHKRRLWVHPVLKCRKELGEFHRLITDLRVKRKPWFFAYFRMTPDVFDELVRNLTPKLMKQPTRTDVISVPERVAVTLRFLATGDSFTSIGFSYRIHKSTVSKIVYETCSAIWQILQPEMMPTPTADFWKQVAAEYESHWQFPNCIGSIDGKHILMQVPSCSGSMYFNYKKTYSVVLLAVVDARYNFVVVDVGAQGKHSDGHVFSNSTFGKKLKNNSLDLPSPSNLPATTTTLPFVFVADEAFPLLNNLMRPYPGRNLSHRQRVFNYRLSRARRIVENAFGVMAFRFRVFRKPLLVQPHVADAVVLACTVLHNYLRHKNSCFYMDTNAVDHEDNEGNFYRGHWRNEDAQLIGLPSLRRTGRRSASKGMETRESLANYFVSEVGAVPWQNNYT